MSKTIRFYFEDHGQDFLWWDVKDSDDFAGEVVDAGPFQASIWADGTHYVNLNEPHGVGDRLITTNDLQRSIKDGYSTRLKYPVTRIEILQEAA